MDFVQGSGDAAPGSQFSVSIIVALLALGGVILSGYMNGKNLIKSDERRSLATITAESVRHENAIRQSARDHLLDRVHDIYTKLEAGRRQFFELSLHVLVEIGTNEGFIPGSRGKFSERIESLRPEFDAALDSVSLFGSKAVSDAAYQVHFKSFVLYYSVAEFEGQMSIDADLVDRTIPGVQRAANDLKLSCEKLFAGMRSEIHPEPAGAPLDKSD
ncbi:hypothetical protein [Myceligenerans xiligouense]|uniref:hypothetical protein n=1 Tax=Myceligenerans xiligouense TaxID=253184 RepID=UPI000F5159A0|nr:hypothetical protein [Myceligenerans xiligouense]